MAIQFLHLPINTISPTTFTITIFSTIACHLASLLLSALSHLRLFKSPADHSDDHLLILDGSSPSLLRVPVHLITACIKTKLPIIPYSESGHRYAGHTAVCMVCLDCIDDSHPIRELVNCQHVFHQECLDLWVDIGHVNCPLCRSMLLPPKKLLSSIAAVPELDRPVL